MNGCAYRAVVTRNCGSGVTSNPAVLTVNALPTITLGVSPVVCESGTTAYLPYSATTGSPDQYRIDYDANANSAGFVDVSTYTTLASSPIVLILPANVVGTYIGELKVKNSNGCESTGVPFTVTINPLPQGSLTGNAICTGGTGKLTWTATAGTGPFTVVYNPGNVTVTNVVSGTPFSIGTITATTNYTLVSVSGVYCPRTSGFTGGTGTVNVLTSGTTFNWTGTQSQDWNTAANWSSGFVPSSCIDVIIPAGLTNFPSLSAPGACNNITIKSGASLVDNSYLTVTGAATVERYIPNDFKWHFISSPVTAQPIWDQFAPAPSGSPLNWGTDPSWPWDFYYWNPKIADMVGTLPWINIRKTNGNYNDGDIDYTGDNISAGFGAAIPKMIKGRGYMAGYNAGWYPTKSSPSTHLFTGILNTGNVSYPGLNTSGNTWYMVGNPYPSSIDWASGSWGTGMEVIKSGSNYSYWIWNETEGTYGAYGYNSATNTGSGINGTTNNIAPQQAFFVKATGTGDFTMNDNIRTHSSQAFLKSAKAEPTNLRLKLTTNKNTYSDEMVVAFNSEFIDGGGTEKFYSMFAEAPELWSVKGNSNYSIDQYKEDNKDITVNLATKAGVEGSFTLTATNSMNFYLYTEVILEDLKTGITQNLRAYPEYTFNGNPSDNVNRFKLHFVTTTTGINNKQDIKEFSIYNHDNQIAVSVLRAFNGTAIVRVYNMLGQLLYTGNLDTASQSELKVRPLVPGAYLVNIRTRSGVTTGKVIIH